MSSMQWDIIIFSGTRSSHDIVELDGVESLVCFGIGKRSSAAETLEPAEEDLLSVNFFHL